MVLIPAVLIVETPTAVSVQTPAATPVNALPSPTNSLAVTIPENVALPLDLTVAAVPTVNAPAVTFPVDGLYVSPVSDSAP